MDEFSDGRTIFTQGAAKRRFTLLEVLIAAVLALCAALVLFGLREQMKDAAEEAAYDKRCRAMNGVPWREDGARLCYQTYGFVHIVGGERAGFDRGAK